MATKPRNGAELVKRLRESHTPEGPLAPARLVLQQVKDDEGRVATVGETLKALADGLGEDHGTVGKARALAETGELPQPKPQAPPIEELLLEDAESKATDPRKPDPRK